MKTRRSNIELELIGKLCCKLLRSRVNPEKGYCEFFFLKDHCCDMQGAINLAKYLMGESLRYIRTYSGEDLDTSYICLGDDSWVAHNRKFDE